MINTEQEYFNKIVDKIDYDNIIAYINSIKSEYNIFKIDESVLSQYYTIIILNKN